jgi:hypothetical protein
MILSGTLVLIPITVLAVITSVSHSPNDSPLIVGNEYTHTVNDTPPSGWDVQAWKLQSRCLEGSSPGPWTTWWYNDHEDFIITEDVIGTTEATLEPRKHCLMTALLSKQSSGFTTPSTSA